MHICKAPLLPNSFSEALIYDNTQFYVQTSHTLLPSRRASHPLADTHFTVSRRVECWVDL